VIIQAEEAIRMESKYETGPRPENSRNGELAPATESERHEHNDEHQHEAVLDENKARQTVERAARESKPIDYNELSANQEHRPSIAAGRELKQLTLKRTLTSLQKRLPLPERVLSRTIHQPTLEAASDALGKTVARPTPLLWAGLTALCGSALLFGAAKRYGFTYNVNTFLLLLGAGWVIGLIIDVCRRLFASLKR
jgi:hypothetical protein